MSSKKRRRAITYAEKKSMRDFGAGRGLAVVVEAYCVFAVDRDQKKHRLHLKSGRKSLLPHGIPSAPMKRSRMRGILT